MQIIKLLLVVAIFSVTNPLKIIGQEKVINTPYILVIFDYYSESKNDIWTDKILDIKKNKRKKIFSVGSDASSCIDEFSYEISKKKITDFKKFLKKYPIIQAQDVNKKIIGKNKIILLEITDKKDTIAYPVTWKRITYTE